MSERFLAEDETVVDQQTGLMWTRDAALTEFPQTWKEALAYVSDLNASGFAGYDDWHLPNRRELFSLISHERINPAVPEPRSFENIFHGYYWTSTSCARLPAQAWYIHFGGAKIYRGMKYASYMVWPVRANEQHINILRTGQHECRDDTGAAVNCRSTGQDAELTIGRSLPEPRYSTSGQTVYDHLTGLTWTRRAAWGDRALNWREAHESVAEMNRGAAFGFSDWRMPHIRELESLVDMARHTPALASDHPFEKIEMHYWSSTTSMYETRYAWTLYLQDGAVGVGFKAKSEFHLWPVRGSIEPTLRH